MLRYESVSELVSQAEARGVRISELVLEDQAEAMEKTPQELLEKMGRDLQVMREAIADGEREGQRSMSGLTGGEGFRMNEYVRRRQGGLCGPFLGRAMSHALAVAGCNASMGRIVAAPTAGSCGILPGCLISLIEEGTISEKEAVLSMFTAGAFGMVIASRASIAGAQGAKRHQGAVAAEMQVHPQTAQAQQACEQERPAPRSPARQPPDQPAKPVTHVQNQQQHVCVVKNVQQSTVPYVTQRVERGAEHGGEKAVGKNAEQAGEPEGKFTVPQRFPQQGRQQKQYAENRQGEPAHKVTGPGGKGGQYGAQRLRRMGNVGLTHGIARSQNAERKAEQQAEQSRQQTEPGPVPHQQEQSQSREGDDTQTQGSHVVAAAQKQGQQAEKQAPPRPAAAEQTDGQRDGRKRKAVKKTVIHRAVIPVEALNRGRQKLDTQQGTQGAHAAAQRPGQTEEIGEHRQAQAKAPQKQGGEDQQRRQSVEPLPENGGLERHEEHSGKTALPGAVGLGGLTRGSTHRRGHGTALRIGAMGGGAIGIVVGAGHVEGTQSKERNQTQQQNQQREDQTQGRAMRRIGIRIHKNPPYIVSSHKKALHEKTD